MSQEEARESARAGPARFRLDRSVAAGPVRVGPGRLAATGVDWLRSDIYLRTESGPVGWRKILLAVACVTAARRSAVSHRGAGSLNTIWIEDAKNLLSQALNSSFAATVKTPISGYYQEPARVITEIAIRFPLSWVPGVMSAAAALQYAVYGLVAYIASGPYLRSPWLRVLIAAPVCVIPLAYTQANNDLVTVQFIGLYGAFWTLLWIPGTRAGRILSPIVMLSVASTAALAIVLAPLVVARLIVDRSRSAIFLAVLWVAGVLLQMSLTLEGKSKHYLFGFNGPLFVLKYYAGRVVPRAIFGESALGGPGANYRGDFEPLHIVNTTAHVALIGSAWAVVVVAVVLRSPASPTRTGPSQWWRGCSAWPCSPTRCSSTPPSSSPATSSPRRCCSTRPSSRCCARGRARGRRSPARPSAGCPSPRSRSSSRWPSRSISA